MLLGLSTISFIEQVDSFFTKMFSSFKDLITLKSLGILLVGIFIGFVLCFSIYGILLLKSITQKEKEIIVSHKIEDSEIRRIARFRYIDDLKWKEVAVRMGKGYSEDFCRQKMNDYLKK